MHKNIKNVLLLLCITAVCTFLTACGKEKNQTEPEQPADQKTEQEPEQETKKAPDYPKETVKIGVEAYNIYDKDFIDLQEYFSYLSEHINVEFVYSDAIMSKRQEREFIDWCKEEGCVGFIGFYNESGIDQAKRVTDHNMFYIDNGTVPELYEEYKEQPYYLGSVSKKEFYYESGVALAQWVMAEQFQNIIFAGGDNSLKDKLYGDIEQGFMDTLKGQQVNVTSLAGFPDEKFFEKQSEILRDQNVDAVCSSYGEPSLWAEPMIAAGLQGISKLGIQETVDESLQGAFEEGDISYLVSENIYLYGIAAALILNGVSGGQDVYREDGKALKIENKPLVIDGEESYLKQLEIRKEKEGFTAEVLLNLCVENNKDTNLDDLKQIIGQK